jgi:hypothetical protein
MNKFGAQFGGLDTKPNSENIPPKNKIIKNNIIESLGNNL